MQSTTEPNVIEVENLTKVFHIVHRESSFKSAMLKRVLRRMVPRRDEYVALRDLSFTVPRGQTVGLVGRNGSGKSTLLTLMAHIYRPSTGRIVVRGRIASLLALGAGFNPDFAGLENIFLNGIILGFSRDELERRLPDIIEFAELGEFIDTPIKHYSSGMVARLGFSVAVHVDPDVLLIDEALAVGDLAFQEKCYNKIEEFKQRGVTIFFVSHDMLAVKRVSDRVIWIDNHVVRADGAPDDVIAQFEADQMAHVPAA
jgi:ABC-type polysaccharide/polyol phosphate transport system ATPase subunit